jgi:predicted aspartyl protease
MTGDIYVDVHLATVLWNGREREIAVLALGQRPLVGTTLLAEHRLSIDFVDRGTVLIDDR